LRAIAFATYEHQHWRPGLTVRDFQPVDGNALLFHAAGIRCTITTLADTSGVIMTQLGSAGVDADFAIDRDDQAVLQARDLEGNLAYNLINAPDPGHQGPLCLAPTDLQREALLQLPEDLDIAVAKLARAIAGTGTPLARASRIAAYLREHNGYSLAYVPIGDPISDFVLNHRSAHCEYFASAAALMMRCAGIPARFVTGYYAHEREAGETVVRGRDAHAWTEAWIEGTGWVTIDATPSDGMPDAMYETPPFWTRLWDFVSDLPRRIRLWFYQIGREAILLLALGAVLFSAVVALIRSLLQRRKPGDRASRGYAGAPPALQAAARRFERAARRRGFILHPSRTWRESIASAPQPYQDFVQIYDTLRFGAAGDARQLQELLVQIEMESRNFPA
jgi:transglutaminase-like putative cysteine protease